MRISRYLLALTFADASGDVTDSARTSYNGLEGVEIETESIAPSPTPVPQPPGVSVRVAKALGSRGYDKLRVSIITESGATAGSGDWDYDAQFQRCWQNDAQRFHLSSKLVSVQPGQSQTVDVGGYSIPVKVPMQGQGSVGLLIADPCIYGSQWCKYADRYAMKETLQTVLNAMAEHDELDYWMNVGDLFYDQAGYATADFFSGLSLTAAGRVHGVTMGNHDYWQNGDPGSAVGSDSFGNFHMQWYAQDAMSSKTDPSDPFDFIQDPSQNQVASADNFQWYNMVGNVAFIAFSNQADWQWQSDFFTEACSWVGQQNPALLVLLGHWNKKDMGCASGMDTPDAYNRVMSLSGCSNLGSRVKYIEGHRHCNGVVQDNVGFLLGSFGMGGGGCTFWKEGDGAFGLPILDTRGDTAKLYYFQLGTHGSRTNNFDNIINCLKTRGVSACTNIPGVHVWMQESISSTSMLANISLPFV